MVARQSSLGVPLMDATAYCLTKAALTTSSSASRLLALVVRVQNCTYNHRKNLRYNRARTAEDSWMQHVAHQGTPQHMHFVTALSVSLQLQISQPCYCRARNCNEGLLKDEDAPGPLGGKLKPTCARLEMRSLPSRGSNSRVTRSLSSTVPSL